MTEHPTTAPDIQREGKGLSQDHAQTVSAVTSGHFTNCRDCGSVNDLMARTCRTCGAALETIASYNQRFDAANEAGQEVFNSGFWHGWMWARYPEWTDNEAEAREEFNRDTDGVALGEAWDANRDTFFARLPLAAISSGQPPIGSSEAEGKETPDTNSLKLQRDRDALLEALKFAAEVEERDLAGDAVMLMEREQWLYMARLAISAAESSGQ